MIYRQRVGLLMVIMVNFWAVISRIDMLNEADPPSKYVSWINITILVIGVLMFLIGERKVKNE